jgi:hypothetical protein
MTFLKSSFKKLRGITVVASFSATTIIVGLVANQANATTDKQLPAADGAIQIRALQANEKKLPHEESVLTRMMNLVTKKIALDYKDNGDIARRDAHPKAGPLLEGALKLNDSLPAELKNLPLFQNGNQTFPLVARASNATVMDDKEGDLHGLAIALFNVEGAKDTDGVVNLVTIDDDHFATKNSGDFGDLMHAVVGVSAARKAYNLIFGYPAYGSSDSHCPFASGTRYADIADVLASKSRGAKTASYLNPVKPYNSQILYDAGNGTHDFKYSFHRINDDKTPTRPDAKKITSNFLSEELVSRLQSSKAGNTPVEFEMKVQLVPRHGNDSSRVENARNVLDEKEFPFITVGKLTFPPQFTAENLAAHFEAAENIALNPGTGMDPMGSVGRARVKFAYPTSVEARRQANGIVVDKAPASIEEVYSKLTGLPNSKTKAWSEKMASEILTNLN